jgi:hypothetical protein
MNTGILDPLDRITQLIRAVAHRYKKACGIGKICLMCHKTDFKSGELTLDHLNNKTRDDRPENLNLLCRSCNVSEKNKGRARLLTAETLLEYLAELPKSAVTDSQVTSVGEGERVSERVEARENEHAAFSVYDGPYKSAIEINQVKEPRHAFWVFLIIEKYGEISAPDAVVGGAQVVDVSKSAAEKYFEKLSYRFGWLIRGLNADGQAVWRFREGIDLKALKKELERKVKGWRPSL